MQPHIPTAEDVGDTPSGRAGRADADTGVGATSTSTGDSASTTDSTDTTRATRDSAGTLATPARLVRRADRSERHGQHEHLVNHMPDQPERTPHIRITRSSITVQGSPAEQPRTFTRHIECSGDERDAEPAAERAAGGRGRGENMRNREGEDRGRRRPG